MKQIPELSRCHHGGEKGENIQYDFSVSLNPLGIPPASLRALNADREAYREYPDTECTRLRQVLAERLSVSPERIVCGAGAADLIYRIPSALGLKRVLLTVPAFSEYERAFRNSGADLVFLQTSPEAGYALRDEFLSMGADFDAIILSSPVNPSGKLIAPGDWRRLLQWGAETDTVIIVDECFLDFASAAKTEELGRIAEEVPEAELIRIRSFTKIYAIAGLRIGYAIFDSPSRAGQVRLWGPPWNVSGPAQKAVLAALSEDDAYLRGTLQYVEKERRRVTGRLRASGFRVWESDVNYLLFEAADSLGETLRKSGFLLRDCSDDRGIIVEPGRRLYRMGLRTEEEDELLLRTIETILKNEEVPAFHRMRKPASIMIQGTMSNAGKSLIAAGLCRIFRQDGYHPAPFKSQNMALNSYITADGKEIGRAQAVQAEAAGIPPESDMNPVLLKPTTEKGSQVIVNGEVRCSMSSTEYFGYRKSLRGEVLEAYRRLGETHDIIVIEGAGSPAEINLTENGDDFVNMGLAEMTGSPVILAGDIDRGGIFAQLGGTMALLCDADRSRVKGVIVNKFRGDLSLFERGREMLREVCGVPVVGVVPFIRVDIDDEDSLSDRLSGRRKKAEGDLLRIAVIRLPRISNFSDLTALDAVEGVCVDYVEHPEELKTADAVIIPGSKSTIEDLLWMREKGLAEAIAGISEKGIPVTGICGGYQMLGLSIADHEAVESRTAEIRGIGLLPVRTEYQRKKVTKQTKARIPDDESLPPELRKQVIRGYEIHMGRSFLMDASASPFSILESGESDGCMAGHVFGTYLHGLFDSRDFTLAYCRWVAALRGRKNTFRMMDYQRYREEQYDRLAAVLRESLDMEAIYRMMGLPGPVPDVEEDEGNTVQ